MQLSGETSIRAAIATITAALLGSGAVRAADPGPGKVDASLLLYSETSRITAAEAMGNYSKLLPSGYTLSARLTFDGLTGATPNGIAPSRKIQSFTRPSGQQSLTIQPGQIPLDPSFHDTRWAFDGSAFKPLDRLTTASTGVHLSKERDYSSVGLNASLTRDIFEKNTTLGLSASYLHDVTSAIGGEPVPFSSMPINTTGSGEGEGEGGGFEGDGGNTQRGPGKGKNVYDVVLGLTQVINRGTVARVNYSFDKEVGYQNDPYKLLSVVQGPSSDSAGDPVDYVYENRPNMRNKSAWYGEIRHHLGSQTIGLSYRYFWDTWGIRSKTADATWQWSTKNGHAIEPHVRWYRQSQADFYRPFLVQGAPLPDFASADSRLARFTGLTFGLRYSFPVDETSRLAITAEYYRQRGDSSPPEAFGILREFNFFPNLNAVMLRIGYSHDL